MEHPSNRFAAWRQAILVLLAVGLAACGSRQAPVSAPAPEASAPAPATATAPASAPGPAPAAAGEPAMTIESIPPGPVITPPAGPSAAGIPPPTPSLATRVDDYKRDFSARVYQTSPAFVYRGRPPPLLRSVVVASVTLDTAGNVVEARILRDNGDEQTVAATLASIRRGAPYPSPPRNLVRGARLQIVETWLFRTDGQFQLRSLAEVQRGE
jgi:protein TonB